MGLAVARELLERHPESAVEVLEKESAVATHQTGRNSGVLHSGLYYRPGSLKARTCQRGKALLERYARDRGVSFEVCGKVVVATHDGELGALERLAGNAEANGLDFHRLDRAGLREREPHVAGVAALHVPSSGIIDYRGVCEALALDLSGSGRGSVRTGQRVVGVDPGPSAAVRVQGGDPRHYDVVINCAGLHSDRVAKGAGVRPATRIVPFRGEYFRLRPDAEHLVRDLVYPVPDARFPFLGVHFTRMIGGGIECGPNAVFALAREGYAWSDVSVRDLASALSWPGTWRLFAKHWRVGLGEMHRSFSKRAFVRALQRLVPEIRAEHLERIPAGVRAQALQRSGELLDDFALQREGAVLHVLNAPSPAATASFAIAEAIVDELERP